MASNNASRTILIIATIVLSILAIVALILNATKESKTYDPKSPEGVIQSFLVAISEHKNSVAAEYLSAMTSCNVDDIDRSYVGSELSVNLISSEIMGELATVTVATEVNSQGPLGGSSQEVHVYRLSKNGDSWKIEGIPWPIFGCEVGTK